MSHTRSQQVAQVAFAAVSARSGAGAAKYLSFARQFPTLIHTCGLAQATAFALAKKKEHGEVLDDLARVLREARRYATAADGTALQRLARDAVVPEYLRLTRDALLATSWLKRYAEALLADADPPAQEGQG